MKINSITQVKPIATNENKIQNDSGEFNNVEIGIKQQKSEKSVTNDKVDPEIVNDDLLERSIEQANKSLKQHHRVIERNVHETTKAVMYTIKDTDTDEVIAEFPPKKIQDMIAKMWELAGMFIDEKA